MIGTVRAFFAVMKTVIAARLSYRADFFISVFIVFAGELILPMVTYLIYQNGASFPGWSLQEVLLIQGVFMLAKGIAYPMFFGIVWNTLERVREGTFDILLLKPRSALFMTLVTGFNTDGVGRLLGGIVILTAALAHLPFFGLSNWLQFLLIFTVSLGVLFSFTLWMSGILFVWVGSSRVHEIFDAAANFGMYPKSIYSKSLQQIITYVLPITVIGFLPASALLDRSMDGLFVTLAVSILFMAVSIAFWHLMLTKYTSAGG